jgi:hypothetical protein
MSRLPQPGSDKGTWGDVLNDYLSQSLNSDGTLKAIDQSKVTGLSTALAAKAPLASPTFTGTVTVPTPSNNTDAATKSYVDTTVSAGTPDANSTTKGKVQLAGDLSGTAAAPTVAKIQGTGVASTAPTTGQVLRYTGSNWTPSGGARTVTSATTLLTSDTVVLADASSVAFTVTLPTAIGFNGRFTITAVTAGTNVVTVATTASQTISGATTQTVGTQASGAGYSSLDVVSDGANWRIV